MCLLHVSWLRLPVSLGMSNPQLVAGGVWLRIAVDAVQHEMVSLFKMLGCFFFFFGHIFGNCVLRFSGTKLTGNTTASQCQRWTEVVDVLPVRLLTCPFTGLFVLEWVFSQSHSVTRLV